jgi:hypothetical protein
MERANLRWAGDVFAKCLQANRFLVACIFVAESYDSKRPHRELQIAWKNALKGCIAPKLHARFRRAGCFSGAPCRHIRDSLRFAVGYGAMPKHTHAKGKCK